MKRFDKKVQLLIDSAILNIDSCTDNNAVLSFYGILSEGFYYGGFVVDNDGNILKGVCNVHDKKKRLPVQLITKADYLNISNFVGWAKDASVLTVGLVVPNIYDVGYFNDSCTWRRALNWLKDPAGHVPWAIYRKNITTKDYLEECIKNIKAEERLKNQLKCAEIIGNNLVDMGEEVSKGLDVVSSSIARSAKFIGHSIDNGAHGLPT